MAKPKENPIKILDDKIASLEVSLELKVTIAKTGSKTLNELLKFKAHELLNEQGFGYRNIIELYQFLEKNNCADLLKEE